MLRKEDSKGQTPGRQAGNEEAAYLRGERRKRGRVPRDIPVMWGGKKKKTGIKINAEGRKITGGDAVLLLPIEKGKRRRAGYG